MARQRSHSITFKRQVAQEFMAGETLYGLSKRSRFSAVVRFSEPRLGTRFRAPVGQPCEFARLDREERLLALRYAQDCYGIERETYVRLARLHRKLLLERGNIPLRSGG